MTTYLVPPRPTLDDLDPESATTDRLIAMVRSHREGEDWCVRANSRYRARVTPAKRGRSDLELGIEAFMRMTKRR
ncbi:MAG TPA: hypothetical protein P5102_05480 [Candidatus Competibacteraceae bacterium]|nr:hypothetical protein [Candidatus Competibacteraceae bacterium]HRZ05594.1 hypothetical protein [Candidatus Competibacteraceae bacterium]